MNYYEIIGYPRLVRLNPNIPWKTRGNGAVCLQVGQLGRNRKQMIGAIDGHEIYSSCVFTKELDAIQQKDLTTLVNKIVETEAYLDGENTNPGYVLLEKKPDCDLYQRTVQTIVYLDDVTRLLANEHATFKGYKNGRGLIGATAAICWEPLDKTYELIAYRPKERWGKKRLVDSISVQHMDTVCVNSFDNYDLKNRHNRIAPNSPCPILYGIRGDKSEELVHASTLVKSEPVDSWLLFETNQGTDDHLQRKSIMEIHPFESVIIQGCVTKKPQSIHGGHVFFTIKDQTGSIPCAAYEPTKEFRTIIRELCFDDRVEVYGGIREYPLTINLEKIKIIELKELKEKIENPICPTCGKHMKSKGTNQGYKCMKCKTTHLYPVFTHKPRTISMGFYEVPVCARRHLSKPVKRMRIEQRNQSRSSSENECIQR